MFKNFPILTHALAVGAVCLCVGYGIAAFIAGGWPSEPYRIGAAIFSCSGFVVAVINGTIEKEDW